MIKFTDDITNYINGEGYYANQVNNSLIRIKFDTNIQTGRVLFARVVNENDLYFIFVIFNVAYNSLSVTQKSYVNSNFNRLGNFIHYRTIKMFENAPNLNQTRLDGMIASITEFDSNTN